MPKTAAFTVDDVTVGPFASGFGRDASGRPYAFRLVGRNLRVEVYRADASAAVPDEDDVVATASSPITDIDIDDERSVVGLVRDLVTHATPRVRPGGAAPRREAAPVAGFSARISAGPTHS